MKYEYKFAEVPYVTSANEKTGIHVPYCYKIIFERSVEE